MDDATRQDETRAARDLTPDQEEFLELYRRLSEVRMETIQVNMQLRGFDPAAHDQPESGDASAPLFPPSKVITARAQLDGVPYEPPSAQEERILRQRLAALTEEAAVLQAQIDRLDAELHPPGGS